MKFVFDSPLWVRAFTSLLLLGSMCVAAPTGTILGTVRDQSGASVSGAQVMIRSTLTNQSRSTSTDDRGNYIATALPLGAYLIEVTYTGFKSATAGEITLQVDQQARIDFTLEVGDASTKVQVSDIVSLVSTDTSSVGQVIDNKKIVDLPLNGRNFTQLAALTPGALTTQVTGTSAPLTGSTTVQVSGSQYMKTEFLFDGISSQEQGLDGIQFLPSVDAVAEFKVQSNSFAAEYGRGAAIINATIKSGTNEFHGVLFEFLRNDKLDARNFFSPSRGVFKQNQFGGTLGGPIVRNRVFFFGNYEGMRLRRGLTRNTLVPSAQWRAGDFSSLPTQLRDPLSQAPIPGNRIPQSSISPTSVNLLQFVPLPNSPSGTFQYLANRAVDGDQGNGRIDAQITEKDSIFLRYSRNVQTDVIPGTLPTSGTLDLDSRAHNAGLGYTRLFSPNLLNEVRLGYTHLSTVGLPQGLGTNYTTQSGIRGFEETSSQFPGFPNIAVTGFGTLLATLNFRPAIAPFDTKQVIEHLTFTKGRHTSKFGVDYRRFHYVEENSGTASRGNFNYGGAYSGNGFADFLLGYPNNGQRSYPTNHFGLSDTQVHFFAQDDFKVTPKLTINIGVRYELNSIPKADLAQSSTFDFSTGKIVVSTLPNGQINLTTQQVADVAYSLYRDRIVTAAEAGYPNDLQENSRKQFAPRFGFAYRPFDNNMTVIRGGYGIFYLLQRANNLASYQIQNTPFSLDELKDNTTPIPTLNTTNFFEAPFGLGFPRIATLQRKLDPPYMQQWNLALQRQLTGTMALDVAYVANKGNKLEQRYTSNYALPGPGNVQSRRPFPQFGAGTQFANIANSIYHSLQVKLEKRMSAGFSVLSAYTWSKLIDDSNIGSQLASVQDPLNFRLERGLGNFDVTHRLVTSFNYEVPFGKGRRFGGATSAISNAVLGGWQIGGIVQFQSGFPFTPLLGAPDPANVGRQYARRPDRVASGEIDDWTVERYFDIGAFRTPQPFTIGNSGRNILRGPGIANWDLSFMKNAYFTERTYLQLRWEMFNAFNTPQFLNPDTTVDPGGPGGRILSARDPRIMQVALKLYF